MERRQLVLRRLPHLAEHLRATTPGRSGSGCSADPPTMRIASNIRSTPSPVVFAVSSAWRERQRHEADRPQVVHLVGLGHLQRRHQRRQIGQITRHQLDERHLLDHLRRLRVVLPLDHPVHVVALAVQELGQVLTVLTGDPGDERARHEHSKVDEAVPDGRPGEFTARYARPSRRRSLVARRAHGPGSPRPRRRPAPRPPHRHRRRRRRAGRRPRRPRRRRGRPVRAQLPVPARAAGAPAAAPGGRRPPPVVGRRSPRVLDRWLGAADVVHGTNYVVPPTRRPAIVSVYDCWFLRHPDQAVAGRPPGRRGPAPPRPRRGDGPRLQPRPRPTPPASCSDATGSRSSTSARSPCRTRRRPRPPPWADRRSAPFVLAVGTVERRKNLPALVAAFGAAGARPTAPRSSSPARPATTARPSTPPSPPCRRPPGAGSCGPGPVDDGHQGVAAAPRPRCSPTRRSTRASGSRSSRPRRSGCRSSPPAPARSPRSPATAPSSSRSATATPSPPPCCACSPTTSTAGALVAAGRGQPRPVLVGGDRRRAWSTCTAGLAGGRVDERPTGRRPCSAAASAPPASCAACSSSCRRSGSPPSSTPATTPCSTGCRSPPTSTRSPTRWPGHRPRAGLGPGRRDVARDGGARPLRARAPAGLDGGDDVVQPRRPRPRHPPLPHGPPGRGRARRPRSPTRCAGPGASTSGCCR